jgi:hypothetical protein
VAFGPPCERRLLPQICEGVKALRFWRTNTRMHQKDQARHCKSCITTSAVSMEYHDGPVCDKATLLQIVHPSVHSFDRNDLFCLINVIVCMMSIIYGDCMHDCKHDREFIDSIFCRVPQSILIYVLYTVILLSPIIMFGLALCSPVLPFYPLK